MYEIITLDAEIYRKKIFQLLFKKKEKTTTKINRKG